MPGSPGSSCCGPSLPSSGSGNGATWARRHPRADPPTGVTTSGRLIARNTLINLAGQALPFFIGLAAMPTIIRGLGTARFGLLGLGWVVVGYFSVLDLGLGRAATRFAADAIGRNALSEIPGIAWSAVLVQAAVGTVGSLALAVMTPFLVSHVLPEIGRAS